MPQPNDLSRRLGRRPVAQHVATAPHRLDVMLAAGRLGDLLAQFSDEDIEDLELGLVRAGIEVVEEHFLVRIVPLRRFSNSRIPYPLPVRLPMTTANGHFKPVNLVANRPA